jgi:hypothetical protein
MPIKLNTASGGGVTLSAANTATDKTITVPADDGTMIYANSSGNVGIGTSSPLSRLHVQETTAAAITLVATGAWSSKIETTSSGNLIFYNDRNTERARIDSSGTLIVNSTSKQNGDVKFSVTANSGAAMETKFTADYYPLLIYRSGNLYGSIYQSGTSTAFNTSSDYRLKENIQPMTGALAKVAALKPCTYTWKFDGSDGQGFIAHELAEVMPDCVTGEKDAMEADGVTPRYQGVDTSFLVATLTAAIQELKAELDITKAKVAALEAQ